MSKKQWQVALMTTKDQRTPDLFSDETLVTLRTQVTTWLTQTRPTFLQSGRFTYEKKGERWVPFVLEGDQQASQAFVKKLPIQRGPEYEEQGLVNGRLALELIRKTVERTDSGEVNAMLGRGWYLLAFQQAYAEHERAYYVLGHTEPDAF